MSPPTVTNGDPLPPPVVQPGGTYSIQDVHVGCKVSIIRKDADGKEEERKAEILSIRDKPVNQYAIQAGIISDTGPRDSADQLEYFVHWEAFNKRLDEWVPGSRIVLARDLTYPQPKAPTSKKESTSKAPPGKAPRQQNQNLLRRATTNAAQASPTPTMSFSTPDFAASPSPAPRAPKRKQHPEEEEEEEGPDEQEGDADADTEMDVDEDGEEAFDINISQDSQTQASTGTFSKEQEIEKLRTSGSMTQSISEITRVKNLNRLQIGKHEVEAWYFSPYPQEYAHLPLLYICEFCLSYFASPMMISRHRMRCTLLHPPGNEIYRHEDISFFEIDGKRQLQWCRNLSLISKCFLDHKTLYYDVTPFMYYIMVQRDDTGCHIIGYFSKEKESAEGYNVACILTLPQHQRHGYGKLLIEFSYALSRVEGKLGSPEKPLSDLGLLGYRAYWAEIIVEFLIGVGADREVSIDEISRETAITHADVQNTCVNLQLIKHFKGQNLICLTNAVLERHEKSKKKKRRRIEASCLKWKPPVFTRDQLRFGW